MLVFDWYQKVVVYGNANERAGKGSERQNIASAKGR